MPITIDGTGSITGISAGGLPDLSVATADIANGAVTQAKRSEDLTQGTAQGSTSGTSIDFTGTPSWAKRITVMFNGVSTSGASLVQVQLGDAGGVETTGYSGASFAIAGTGSQGYNYTSGAVFNSAADAATAVRHGLMTIANLSGNVWVLSGNVGYSDGTRVASAHYSKTLSETLDRVRITTVNGTDTFDAGSINIFYE